MEKTDEGLIREYLAGDEQAFEQLVQRHLRKVYSFAARSLPSDAEDITQDAFLKVWKNLDSYDSSASTFATWLMRIARNTVIDYSRRKKSTPFTLFQNKDAESELDSLIDPEVRPEEFAAQAHDARELEAAVSKLAPAYREVLLLHYMSGFTLEEIAKVLEASSNTVRSRHRRALIEVRKLMHHSR